MGAMVSTCATNGATAGAMIIRADMVRAVPVGDLVVLIPAAVPVVPADPAVRVALAVLVVPVCLADPAAGPVAVPVADPAADPVADPVAVHIHAPPLPVTRVLVAAHTRIRKDRIRILRLGASAPGRSFDSPLKSILETIGRSVSVRRKGMARAPRWAAMRQACLTLYLPLLACARILPRK